MTRFLSESLAAREPYFRIGLQQLERAHGHPATDIRLTSAVAQATRAKIQALGLDPIDTTPEELYQAVCERLKADDARLTRRLRIEAATYISAEADVMAGMARALQNLPQQRAGYALKPSVMKNLLKKQPPKKAMKALGYRSLASFLKHQSPATIVAAGLLTETANWRKNLSDSYKTLKPADFETRQLSIEHPTTKRWQQLAASSLAAKRHSLISLPELGAIVLLPLPPQAPAGTVTASLSLALRALNQLRANATYLKLCQVRPDFGAIVQALVRQEPQFQVSLLEHNVSWQLLQRYYARMQHLFNEELFEPHIRLDDLAWHNEEQSLSQIEPSLHFWQGSQFLGLLHKGRPLSLNIIDAALNVCNDVPFDRRLHGHYQKSLWHELSLRYLQHDQVEQTVLSLLQPKLMPVVATN